MLSLRISAPRPAMTGVRPARRAAASIIARADPKSPVEAAIDEAKETCADGSSSECAVAWDTVRRGVGSLVHPAQPRPVLCAPV